MWINSCPLHHPYIVLGIFNKIRAPENWLTLEHMTILYTSSLKTIKIYGTTIYGMISQLFSIALSHLYFFGRYRFCWVGKLVITVGQHDMIMYTGRVLRGIYYRRHALNSVKTHGGTEQITKFRRWWTKSDWFFFDRRNTTIRFPRNSSAASCRRALNAITVMRSDVLTKTVLFLWYFLPTPPKNR